MWRCTDCGIVLKRRSELLKHYKLNHRHYGRGHSYPCTYLHSRFGMPYWANYQGITLPNKLSTKLYQHSHAIFFVKINSPLRGNFFNTSLIILKIRRLLHACSKTEYKTNVYENFKSHKYRKHSGTGNIFKPGTNYITEPVFASLASDISDGNV